MQTITDLSPDTMQLGWRLAAGLAVFVTTWVLAWAFQVLLRRIGLRTASRKDDEVWAFLGQLVKIGVLTFGIVTALGTMGVNVSALVAGLGLTGFALGFALRDAISNLLAGVLILLYRPFHIGDQIAVAGYEGRVVAIDLRYTTLASDDKRYLIPNSLLFTNTVTLITMPPEPRPVHRPVHEVVEAAHR